ncbi:Retrovirus-related Pol polyprotein from transposon TNT 1-94 [Senna tora]|uniref:Retrovirus-related Pol polyprotein from transposon TNT 1-94 n=1 Tax=Senna tora TaxID=362788 RepID=A0A834WI07_9FABA|nr:Retrovirus-related Pol polyprotein from transposon TNT 1-94 [Senna tora]
MFMRMTIANNIKTNIPQTENAKEYLKFVEKCFRTADKSLAVNLVGQGAGKTLKPKANKFKKGKTPVNAPNVERKDQKASKCHFCGKDGYFQKDCLKRKAWFEKKDKSSALVCYESNLAKVPYNTWWLDYGATT